MSKEKKPFYVKVCLKCRSLNVAIENQGQLSGFVAFGAALFTDAKTVGLKL